MPPPCVSRSVEGALRTLGYRVVSAEAREEVPAALGTQSADVALVDMQMPGLALDEFLRELGARHPSMSIVLTSGDPEAQLGDALRALTPAAMSFIAKPFNPAQLGAALRAVLHPAQ